MPATSRAGSCLTVIKKCHDLRHGRGCWRGLERYVTSLMPRDGIFRDAVASRYVAIRHPSLEIGLNFMALGVPADGAGPRHTIDLPGSWTISRAECFFRPARAHQHCQPITSSVSLERPTPRVLQASSSPCDGALRNSPTAAAVAWAGEPENSTIDFVLRVPP
jgi:hypothetical protein